LEVIHGKFKEKATKMMTITTATAATTAANCICRYLHEIWKSDN